MIATEACSCGARLTIEGGTEVIIVLREWRRRHRHECPTVDPAPLSEVEPGWTTIPGDTSGTLVPDNYTLAEFRAPGGVT